MKKILTIVSFIILLIFTSCINKSGVENLVHNTYDEYKINMKRDILTLMMAYPGYIVNVENNDDKVFIIMKSGSKILYDDKKSKTYDQKLNNPDLQDMLKQDYPLNNIKTLMEKDYDPGRIRVYSLLKEVYGSNKSKIQSNIKNTKFGYNNVQFNSNNNANKALNKAGNEINSLIKNNGKVYKNVYPLSGTFNYRVIKGTNRLSPHSFGIAIDLKRDNRDYWKWASEEKGIERIAGYPMEIVKIFEKNNFIWGGKWNHFDILHYEYRPELIIKSKYNSYVRGKPWHYEYPINDDTVRKYINIIDSVIK